ncbi:hypothetical protein [Planotetraspora sp. GP83]|uniref:hypothetical protein n=1 Tax=Planotetraspora sp. GP83 TaxID=3156264 RepID=UPI0035189517
MGSLSAFEMAALALIVAAIVLRFYDFWKLPGINGDEPWYGVQALRFTAGEQVDVRTPTGNLQSPLQPGLLWALHFFVDPAPSLLRIPTLVSSILQIGVMAWGANRVFGRRAAFAAATMCAVLPLNIAYARFGQDPDHLGLVAALATVAVLNRRLILGVALYAFGIWVHPTCVFLAPFLLLVSIGAELPERRSGRAWLRCAAAIVGFGAAALLVKLIVSDGNRFANLHQIWDRLSSLDRWLLQGTRLAHFFLGDTTYQYIAGARFPGPQAAWAIAFWLIAGFLVGFGMWRLIRARDLRGLAIVVGAMATHFAFYLIGGPQALAPSVERYGLCLVVPSLFAAVVLAGAGKKPDSSELAATKGLSSIAVSRLCRTAPVVAGVAWIVMGVMLLAGFTRYYLVELLHTGSRSEQTFWTGPTEPKAAAVQRILSERRPGSSVVIVADGWWTYWIVRYLTYRSPDVLVTEGLSRATLRSPGKDVFVMGYPDGPVGDLIGKFGGTKEFERFDVPGYGRQSVIQLWHHKRIGTAA